ncbi:MAG: hypothetical protein HY821_09770 [Acidobacteria bacterium]|nr:hypothetical protein [Acidobacteriota bacterium]
MSSARMYRIVLLSFLLSLAISAGEFSRTAIVAGAQATPIERSVAALLAERISEPSGIPARIVAEPFAAPAPGELVILLGVPARHTALRTRFEQLRIPALTDLEPGPEGFLLQTDGATLLAAGRDERGLLYAAGELLRRLDIRARSFVLPAPLKVRTAPAFEIRGTQFGQSGVALGKGKVREWTGRELRHAILDFALAGLNTLEVHEQLGQKDVRFQVAREFGLKTLVHYSANAGDGPPEWRATESIGRSGYLCPSVPAARQALIQRCENSFRRIPPVDYIRFSGGDGGGCECDRCKPYGGKFIRLCEDMAAAVRQFSPKTQFFITNQKFDNDDDKAIFEYLREQPRPWLRAFCYGPGSDAMSWQPGHRQTHRMDLFRYPGFGPYDRYLKEILHELPPGNDIVFFNELTHWRYSQNGYAQAPPRADRNGDRPPHWNDFLYRRQPDRAITMVYDRLTFFAWPRYFHWVFGETMRYGIGDVTHSSCTQDHFNQWMWQRLLWAPQTTLDDVVAEYTRAWFGPEAAPLMAKALFELEDYLAEKPGEPITAKTSIASYYNHVRDAGLRMTPVRMKSNWLWREYMQKGALDRWIQERVRQQTSQRKQVESLIATGPSDSVIARAMALLQAPRETPEMQRLRAEATRLGEESNQLFGVRSEGIYNLEHDFIGLGWLQRQLERARAAHGAERAELLRMITHYDDPGEGGFYDDGGTLDHAPNIVAGYPYDFGQPFVSEMLSEANRPSQRTMHFTQDEDQGVTFRYRNLNPNASWRIRFTLVRPWYQERYRARMNQESETIYAGDQVLARDVKVPERMSDFFTYDIPREAVKDGELVIRFERAPGVAHGTRTEREIWRNSGGWGTIVAEAWLMKAPRR